MIDHNSIKRFRFEAAEYTNEIKPLGITKWNEIRDMKFAELIIRECAGIATDCNSDMTAAEVLKHFGVQE